MVMKLIATVCCVCVCMCLCVCGCVGVQDQVLHVPVCRDQGQESHHHAGSHCVQSPSGEACLSEQSVQERASGELRVSVGKREGEEASIAMVHTGTRVCGRLSCGNV